MELEFVLIADAVENVNGKLYLLGGGWYQFTSHSFPAVARIAVAVGITHDEHDTGQHRVKITLCEHGFDADKAIRQPLPGNVQRGVLEIEAGIQIPTPRNGRQFVAFNGAFPLPMAGVYEVSAVLDGDQNKKKTITFEAVLATPVSTTPPVLN